MVFLVLFINYYVKVSGELGVYVLRNFKYNILVLIGVGSNILIWLVKYTRGFMFKKKLKLFDILSCFELIKIEINK